MTGSKKRRRRAVRQENTRTDQISTAVRLVTMVWEIVWTIIHEMVARGTGPGRLL
jgi:hypothetical protein